MPYTEILRPRLTVDTVALGQRVVRNPAHWRPRKWRDDRKRPGTVVGFTDANATLVGINSGSPYDTESITPESGAAWAVVLWDATRKVSVYPIGASGPLGNWWTECGGGPCHSLLRLANRRIPSVWVCVVSNNKDVYA